ncbi:hypothetical protein KEM55_009262, partial [Ascosphaera atra]
SDPRGHSSPAPSLEQEDPGETTPAAGDWGWGLLHRDGSEGKNETASPGRHPHLAAAKASRQEAGGDEMRQTSRQRRWHH